MNAFLRQYLETALWSSIDDDGEPMDRNFSVRDVSEQTRRQAAEDCAAFEEANAADLALCYASGYLDRETAGHCLWLNRNGHGTGFWDRYYGCKDAEAIAAFKRLSEAAKAMGAADLYAGDDGEIYTFPHREAKGGAA